MTFSVSFLSLFFSFLLPPSPSPRPLFHREFASVFFYPVFSGSLVSFLSLFFSFFPPPPPPAPCFIENLLQSSSTQFLVVLLFIVFCTPFCSKHFVLGLFVRSLSTQLFFLVVLLLLLLSMIAFSYVGLLSLFWVRLFHFTWAIFQPALFLRGCLLSSL